ncbi:MAG TPA: MFS transporter [Thermoanaerobaculia bacterium]|jgi:MFS family permease|nr:MFS transporter [Thermoanaerobaculia bacterium]
MAPIEKTDFKTFGTMWLGQLVSLIGSGLTGFALGVWVLEHTHSVTQYTLTIVFAGLPGILIGPIAGAYVDRWDRKWVMFFTDLGPALTVLAYAYLLSTNQLQVWHVYIGVFFNSILGTFQWPAYIASVTMLVARKDYPRVNGLLELGQSINLIAAPAISGALMIWIGLRNILLIDFATFLFAASALLLVKIPRPEESAEGRRAKGSIWKEAAFGWVFIKERPGLLNLLLLFACVNLVMSMCGVAVLPMVLGFANKAAVGTIMSLVGVGTLIGGAIMTATGGFKKKVHGVLLAWAALSVWFVMVGIKPNLYLVGAGVLCWYIGLPIMNASSQAIWQLKTPHDVQGRVFAVRRMIAQFTVPIGDFSAGPLADKVFNPALMPGGALSDSVGRVVGVGPGRGIGLMLLTMAIVPAVTALVGFLNPRVRNVEAELPDAYRKPAPKPEPAPEAEAPKEAAAQA